MDEMIRRCTNPWCQSTNVTMLGEVPGLADFDETEEATQSSTRPVAMHCNACGKDFVREVPLAFVPGRMPH